MPNFSLPRQNSYISTWREYPSLKKQTGISVYGKQANRTLQTSWVFFPVQRDVSKPARSWLRKPIQSRESKETLAYQLSREMERLQLYTMSLIPLHDPAPNRHLSLTLVSSQPANTLTFPKSVSVCFPTDPTTGAKERRTHPVQRKSKLH